MSVGLSADMCTYNICIYVYIGILVRDRTSSLSHTHPLSLFLSLCRLRIMYVYAGSGESHLGKYSVVVSADAKPGDTLTIRYEDTHIVA